MRTVLLLLLLALPATAAGVELSADAVEVELGRGFALTVRTPAGGEWAEERLAPLTVVLRDQSRHGEVETLSYLAYAFTPGELTIDPGDGATPLLLRVVPTLDPEDPGAVELPGEPFGAGSGPGWFWLVAIVVAVGGAAVLFRRRDEAAPVGSQTLNESEGPAHETALARLAALRGVEPATHNETQRWFIEASGIVREYVGARFDVRTDVLTTVECLRLPVIGSAPAESFLRAYLVRCDEVKFGRDRPDGAERVDLLDRAEAFVRREAGEVDG